MSARRPWLAVFVAALIVFSPSSGFAQETDAKKLQQQLDELQKQIKELSQKAEAIQKSLDAMNGGSTAAATTETHSDDLLSVQPIETPATAEAAPSTSTATTETAQLPTEPVSNPSSTAVSKVFNPDISVIGNVLAHAGDDNPHQPRESVVLDESEVAFEAFVDPYAKAKFFLSVTPDGVEMEEGFANFVTLPWDLSAKVGKMKATFGKDNTWHAHVRPWADQPLVITNFFGEEGLNDSGISVSKIIPSSFAYVEATGEVLNGNAGDGVFAKKHSNDLLYNAHVKMFKDLSENSNLELGASYTRGTTAFTDEVSGRNQFVGADLTYRWKPLIKSTRQSFIGRTEIIQNRREDQSRHAWGFYSSADYQLAQRWFTGVRFDRAAHADDPSLRDKGFAATLTFWPSEFSQLRGEFRRVQYPDTTANELLLQLQFSIGAHGAHTF